MRGKRVGYLRNIGAGTGKVRHCAGWPNCIDGCQGFKATRASEKRELKKEIQLQVQETQEYTFIVPIS